MYEVYGSSEYAIKEDHGILWPIATIAVYSRSNCGIVFFVENRYLDNSLILDRYFSEARLLNCLFNL